MFGQDRNNGVRFQRRLRRLVQQYATGEITLERLEASLRDWVAHAAHGDTWGLRRSLLGQQIIIPPAAQPAGGSERNE